MHEGRELLIFCLIVSTTLTFPFALPYRYTAVVPHGQQFAESADSSLYKDWYSNFLDFESILSSRSFLEGEMNDR